MASELLECPFCGYKTEDAYSISLHVEQFHIDDSPFRVREVSPPPPQLPNQHDSALATKDSLIEKAQDEWVQCPQQDCGEEVLLAELSEHLDLHFAETLSSEDDGSVTRSNMASSAFSHHSFGHDHYSARSPEESPHHSLSKSPGAPSSGEKATLKRSIEGVTHGRSRTTKSRSDGSRSIRLGKSELGPYAFEDKMPAWLHRQLEDGGKVTIIQRIGRDGKLIKDRAVENEVPNMLPVLVRLINQDESVKTAYFCHPSVQHVSKLPREGGFCGYRNTQMLISYLQGAKAPGHTEFGAEVPGVLALQNMIEAAWDMGFCEVARVQTGGIKGTRKYIGTPEVAALLSGLGIDFQTSSFHDVHNGKTAACQLLDYVEHYFDQAAPSSDDKIHKTTLPPIYLQRPGHSLTIVGFETRKNGDRSLLVFDPMYVVSKEMRRLRDSAINRPKPPGTLLRMYRRELHSLSRYQDFETLTLTGLSPLTSAWDDV